MKKRLLSFALAFCMMLTQLPILSMAEEADTSAASGESIPFSPLDEAEISVSTDYGIWVGTTKVTSENAGDVLGDGTVSYDAASDTLTLNNASITSLCPPGTGEGQNGNYYGNCGGIFKNSGDLNIDLIGSSSVDISGVTGQYRPCGIYAFWGTVKITSTVAGSLTVISAPSTQFSYGISGNGVTINGCTVTATGGNTSGSSNNASGGIFSSSFGSLNITDATVTANGGDTTDTGETLYNGGSYGIFCGSAATTIANSTVSANGGTSGSNISHGMYAIGSTTFSASAITATGDTRALNLTGSVTATGLIATAGADKTGTGATVVVFNVGVYASSSPYKYVRIAPAPPAQVRWGIAGSDGAAPTAWTQGTLADAVTNANGLTGGTLYIQLLEDINKDNHNTWPMTFASGKSTVLDLNGKDINRGLTMATANGNVITVSGSLTLKDSSTTEASNQGHITGGYSSNDNGGGVCVSGNFTLQGGDITGNKTSVWGGGVRVKSGASFIMQGGSITGNEATIDGGAVSVPDATFHMTGGSITGNKSSHVGGISIYASGTYKIGGTAVIKDNIETGGGTKCNVFLYSYNSLSIDMPLATGASIWVTSIDAPTSGSPRNITGANSADYSGYFFSDSSSYIIQNGASNVVQLAAPVPVIGTLSIPDSFMAGRRLVLSDLTQYIPTVTPNGIAITAQGWQNSVNSGGWVPWTASNGYIPLDTASTRQICYYVTYSGSGGETTITSNAITFNVVGYTTALALTTVPSNQQIMGNIVTLTATLTGFYSDSNVNGQQITFKNGGTTLGTASLNADGVAAYTWRPSVADNYILTAEYAANGYNKAATSSTVGYTVTVDPDTAIIAAAKTAAQNASYANMTQATAPDENAIKTALQNTAAAAVNNSGVTVTINRVNHTVPIAGTSSNPRGTNGGYIFTITVSKGTQRETTDEKNIGITATAYTSVTDAEAIVAAKTALVDGSVDVAFNADQTAKTAAVQAYVSTLLTGDAAGVTATVSYNSTTGKYEVVLSKGSVNDSKSLSMTVNVAPEQDIATVAAAKAAAQGVSYADMTQATATDEDTIETALKSAAKTAVNNSEVTVAINKVSYTAPIAGTSANPSGTNGSYTFTVTVSKGSQSETTEQKTITVTATAYTGGNGGNGGNGNNDSDSGSNSTPSTKPTEPVTGSTENKATVDNKGNASVSLTDKNITDAIADAKAEAAKKGVIAGDITAVIHVTTAGKDANTVTVNLPKTTQEQVIRNKIASVQLVIDRPDLTIGIDLAAVTEINRQAKADVQLSATRMDNTRLSGDAKAVIGSRPAYDFKALYGSGKSVTDFGNGSVSVEIPYALQKGEIAGNVYAVYVDAKGKVTYLTDSSYDAQRGTVMFSTSHFSTYGVAYKASFNFTDIDGHWAKDDILFVANRGLMIGTSATTFNPNGSMTRGMFVTAIGRLADADTSAYKKSSFTDVRADAYYMGYIEWGVKNNILVGIGGGKFDPDGLVTREQMAVIMDKYATAIGYKLPEVHAQIVFADNAMIGAWAAPSVKRIQMAGIIQGKNNNLYDPRGTASRAEVTAVLRRFVELTVFSDTAQGWTMNDYGK